MCPSSKALPCSITDDDSLTDTQDGTSSKYGGPSFPLKMPQPCTPSNPPPTRSGANYVQGALNWGSTPALNAVAMTYSWLTDRCAPFSAA
jgi:hypothetical protein